MLGADRTMVGFVDDGRVDGTAAATTLAMAFSTKSRACCSLLGAGRATAAAPDGLAGRDDTGRRGMGLVVGRAGGETGRILDNIGRRGVGLTVGRVLPLESGRGREVGRIVGRERRWDSGWEYGSMPMAASRSLRHPLLPQLCQPHGACWHG